MNMKNAPVCLFKLLICMSFLGVAVAQTNASCPPPPMPLDQAMEYIAKMPAKNAGFLWRFEKDGRTGWLYGTMHLMHIDYAKPGMQVMMGMRTSDVLAVEVNTYEHQAQQQPPAHRPTFKLSSEQLERLRRAYKNDCLTTEPEQHYATPLHNSQANRRGLYWGYGPDARLMQIAKRTNKPIVSLESFILQVDALRPRSQAEFDEQVNVSLQDVETGQMQADLSETAIAWQQNNLSFFNRYEQVMTAKQPVFMRRLNDDRNVQMAQKIDTLHSEGKRVFVAVGALHMTGQHAIPKLLQDKGYAVHFVPLKN